MHLIGKGAFLMACIAATAFGGCGSSSDSGTGGNGGGGGSGGAACTPGSAVADVIDCAGQTPAKTITMQGFAFSPASESVSVGDVVEFNNQDTVAHTSTSGTPSCPDNGWDTGNIAHGATKCLKFTKAGSYTYFCAIHTNMTGSITVN